MEIKFFLLVLCVSLVTVSFSQPTTNCSLTVSNKIEFENGILEYLDENSKTLILEYDLDFSGVGNNFDLHNRTNPDAFQPWRWYRTKGKGVERLLLFYATYLFDSLLIVTFKNVKVRLTASPSGCLNDINRDDMEPFIRKFLLDDFEIKVDALRTSRKLNENADICTAHLTSTFDNTSADLSYWCCGYDLHNNMSCYSISFDSSISVALLIVAFFIFLLYLYSPMLFPKAVKTRKMIYAQNDIKETNFMIQEGKRNCCRMAICQCGATEILRINETESYMKKFYTMLYPLNRNVKYTAKVTKINVAENKNSFMREDEKTIYSLISFVTFFMSGTSHSDKRATSTRWTRIFVKFFIFFLLCTTPSIIYYYFNVFNNSFDKDLNQAYVDRGLRSTSEVIYNASSIVLASLHFSCQILLFIIIFLDDLRNDNFGTAVAKLTEKMKDSWRSIFDKLNKGYRKNFFMIFIYIIASPLIIFFTLFSSSPMMIIAFSFIPTKHSGNPFLFYIVFCVTNAIFILMLYPLVIISQIFIVVVSLLMFQATIILPVLSGLGALLLNLRLFARTIGRKHDNCLKNIVYLVNINKDVVSPIINSPVTARQPNSTPAGKLTVQYYY